LRACGLAGLRACGLAGLRAAERHLVDGVASIYEVAEVRLGA